MRISERTCEALLFAVTLSILNSHSTSAATDRESSEYIHQNSSPATPKSTRDAIVDTHDTTSSPGMLSTFFQNDIIVPPSVINLANISSSVIFSKPARIVKVNTSDTINQINTSKLSNTLSTISQWEIPLNSKASDTLSTIPPLEMVVNAATSSLASLTKHSSTTQLPEISESQVPSSQEGNNHSILEGRQFKSTASPYSYSATTRRLSSSTFAPVVQKNDVTVGYMKTSTPYSSLSKPTVLQSKSSTTSGVKASTYSTINADAVLFISRKTTPTTSSSIGKIPQRPVTPSTTYVNVLWNGVNETAGTSTTPFLLSTLNSTTRNNLNATSQKNEIDFKEIITAPINAASCPEGKMIGADGQCHEVYKSDKSK